MQTLLQRADSYMTEEGRQLLERELVERQLGDDSWAIRQLLATKIGRMRN
jgi:hypothetical protein